jgi:hypothetical protein
MIKIFNKKHVTILANYWRNGTAEVLQALTKAQVVSRVILELVLERG